MDKIDTTHGVISVIPVAVNALLGDSWWRWDHPGSAGNRSFVLWLIIRGRGTLDAGGDHFDLRTGDCIVSPLCEPHRGRHHPADPLHIYHSRFHFVGPEGDIRTPSPVPARYRRPRNFGFIKDLFARALTAERLGGRGSDSARMWLTALVTAIAEDEVSVPWSGPDAAVRDRVLAVAAAIREGPRADHPLPAVAAQLNCTPDHCIRLFRKYPATTPHDLVIQSRVDEACRLPTLSSMSVSLVARHLGYCDVQHFSRQFRQRTGRSPSEWRRAG